MSQILINNYLKQIDIIRRVSGSQVTNLIGDAVQAGRIKRKDEGIGNKFAEYLPYWA